MANLVDKKRAGFTQVELVVVVVLMALLVLWVLPTIFRRDTKQHAQRLTCVNNLKQIGIAYRVWATDNNDFLPAQATCAQGGWKDLLTNGSSGNYCWTNFALMHTELGESPKVVVCPLDERRGNAYKQTGASGYIPFGSSTFSNKTLSYFVGVGAGDLFPKSILGGDRNLCAGPTPDKNYGFSPENGMGNDITIGTDPNASPLSWSAKLHTIEFKQPKGVGDILFGDGSVQLCSSAQLRGYQAAALDSGNWPSNAIPKAPSFRLVFP